MKPMSFRQRLKEHKLFPSRETFLGLWKTFQESYRKDRRKPGTYPEWTEEKEIEAGVLIEEMMKVVQRNREKTVSTGVTEDTIQRAAQRVRMLLRRERVYRYRNQSFIPGEKSPFGRVEPIIDPHYITEKVLELQAYLDEDVIEPIDLYFLLVKAKNLSVKLAAELLEINPSTARSILERALERMQSGESKKKGRPKQEVDEEVLFWAIREIIEW